MLALLAVGGLRFSLPESLSAGPDWMLIVIVGVLLIPTAWARQRGKDDLNKFLGYLLSSIVTVDMIWSLGLLVAALPAHRQSPRICCGPQLPYGLRTSWSSPRGTGVWMQVARANVSCAACIPTERSFFRR